MIEEHVDAVTFEADHSAARTKRHRRIVCQHQHTIAKRKYTSRNLNNSLQTHTRTHSHNTTTTTQQQQTSASGSMSGVRICS
jgi:hypothetical protein